MQASHQSDSLPSERRNFSWLIVLLLVCIFAAVAWLSVRHVNTLWDEMTDHQIALGLLEHPLQGNGLDGSQARLPMYITAAAYAVMGPSLEIARLISIVVASAAIGLTFYAGRQWFGKSVGLIAAGLLAFSPYFISFSRTAMTESDAFCPLTVLLMLLAFHAYTLRRDSRRLVIFSLTLGLALATKFYAIMFVPALVLCDFIQSRIQSSDDPAVRPQKYIPTQHKSLVLWVVISSLLLFMVLCATQLKLTGLAVSLWIVSVIILLLGLRELLAFIPGKRFMIKRSVYWPVFTGWWVILLLAGSVCLAAFPEHVLQPEVPRALFRRLIRQDHTLPMVRFLDPARLYLGSLLFKLGLPLGLMTAAALVWAWIRSAREAAVRVLMAIVAFYILFLLILPIRQSFYLMCIYPLLMLILAVFIVRMARVLAGRDRLQSAWIALVITGCLWMAWGDFRVYPEFGYYGYEVVGDHWLGAESRGYRNLVQVTNDGTEDAFDWCMANVRPGMRVVSYLWDDHVIDAYVDQHDPAFELVRRYAEINAQQGPVYEDADFFIVGLNNQTGYFDAPTMKQLVEQFEPIPARIIERGRGRYRMPVVKIYQRRQATETLKR